MSEVVESKIKHFSAIFFVSKREQVLDYYSKLTDAIVPNYPVHGENAVNVYAMVEGVDNLYDEFKAKGALFQYELRSNNYQMKEFAIKDPQGYTIGFGESLI